MQSTWRTRYNHIITDRRVYYEETNLFYKTFFYKEVAKSFFYKEVPKRHLERTTAPVPNYFILFCFVYLVCFFLPQFSPPNYSVNVNLE